MTKKYTVVTEEVFNTVRNLQVVKNYPYEIIRNKTGVARTNQDLIRKAKTYEGWVASHPRLANRAAKAQAASQPDLSGNAIGMDETFAKLDALTTIEPQLPEHTCATRADLNRVVNVQMTDVGKLYGEIKTLRTRDAANSRSITNLAKSGDASFARIGDMVARLDKATADMITQQASEIDSLRLQLEDVLAFVAVVHASPTLERLLRRAAKRIEKVQYEGEN